MFCVQPPSLLLLPHLGWNECSARHVRRVYHVMLNVQVIDANGKEDFVSSCFDASFAAHTVALGVQHSHNL
jgi:hypothetical protein